MAKLTPDLIERYEDAKNLHREQWRSFLRRAYKYINPNRQMWDQQGDTWKYKTEANRDNQDVYDITAVLAARAFGSKIHATLTPPFQRWAKYTSPANVPEIEKDFINQQLEVATENLFKYFNQSSIDLALSECYADLVFGTMSLKISEGSDDKPFIFQCIPLSQIAFEEDGYGHIKTTWQDFVNLKFRDIMRIWPDAKLPSSVEINAKNNPESKLPITQGFIYSEKSNDYTNQVSLTESHEIILEEKGIESSPFIIARWTKMPGEVFGRGIAHDIMPDVLTLNKMMEYMFTASAMSMFPPMMGDSTRMINPENIKMAPNTIIPVNSTLGNPPLQPLEIQPNLQLAQLNIEGIQATINKACFGDPLGKVSDPAKTATEITLRQQQLLEEIGPAFGRLEVEFLSKIIDRCTFILKKKGFGPDIKIDGKEITLKYLSPLARVQDRQDIQAFTETLQILVEILGQQLVLGILNIPLVPTWLANKLGADLTLFKTDVEVAKIIAKLLEQAQQQPEEAAPSPEGTQAAQPAQQPPTNQ
jgi:hypothetical protein